MNISLNWLKEFVRIEKTAEEVSQTLTSVGLEVETLETYEPIKGGLRGLVVGEVKTCEKHPNADKLSCTTVDIGSEIVPIVCGAPNVAAGQKVIVATVEATLYPTSGEPFTIKKAKIRGEESQGMICAEDEIGLGTSHEGIMVLETKLANGTPAAEYFEMTEDTVFVIGLTPNRIDAASHFGTARDLAAAWELDLCRHDLSAFKVDNTNRNIAIEVKNPEACVRYAGLTITGVKIAPSPEWLQHRLKAIGLSPINNIVDITNYVLHELGQPLHAFDADKIVGNKVIVRTLAQDTPFVSLDKQTRKLHANDLIICDGQENPMCIAGVFGGAESGVSASTTSIFLESACFNSTFVRKTSQFHGLKTDASFRFERGTDPNMPVFALKRAAMLIKQIAGGEISSDIIDIYPNPVQNFEIEVKYKHIDRLIGKKLEKQTIKSILNRLEIRVLEENEETIKVSVPPYRVDVQREADVIEEILRIYGFAQVEIGNYLKSDYLAEFPEVDPFKIKRGLTEMLVGLGFSEIITNSLTKPSYSASLQMLGNERDVEIANKLSNDLGVMRQTLLFSGLEVVAYNINRRQKDLKLFEFGKTYQKTEGVGLEKYVEKEKLAIFLTGNRHAETWQFRSESLRFADIADAVSKVLAKLGIKDFEQQELEFEPFQYGLAWVSKKTEWAKIGLLKKTVTAQLDIKQEVFYAELDLETLLKRYNPTKTFTEIPKFPSVRRDLSLVLDKNVSFETLKKIAFQTEKNFLEKINVFDVYEGDKVGEGKKSYSLSFVLQDLNATLTDQVIDKTMNKLMNAFETQVNALIRK